VLKSEYLKLSWLYETTLNIENQERYIIKGCILFIPLLRSKLYASRSYGLYTEFSDRFELIAISISNAKEYSSINSSAEELILG
jgi:hypothetical protein